MWVSKLGAFTGLLLPEVGQNILQNSICILFRASCWKLLEDALGKTVVLWLLLRVVLAVGV